MTKWRICTQVVLLAATAVAASPAPDTQQQILWKLDAEYSDTFSHKGHAYKTIHFSNLFIAVSFMGVERIGGSRLSPDYYTFAGLIVQNKGDERIDLTGSRCVCTDDKKEKILEYSEPRTVREPRFEGAFARAPHTLFPGDDLRGLLTFRGRCKGAVLVEITVQTKVVQFPFP